MSVKPVAILSDIHGNRWALQAVLDDITRHGIENIVNLGDSLYGPLDPAATAQMLMEHEIPTVRGNEDRILIEALPSAAHSPSLRYVLDRLTAKHIEWLETLEMTAIVNGDFFLCHGTPTRDDEYLLQEVFEEGASLREPGTVESIVGFLDQPVVLCGHDHIARTMQLPNGMLVVNPGSVGLPAYKDDVPHPHVMESGTPHARYSIVWWQKGQCRVAEQTVEYDWGIAAEVARKNGRLDWAEWLRTGSAVSVL